MPSNRFKDCSYSCPSPSRGILSIYRERYYALLFQPTQGYLEVVFRLHRLICLSKCFNVLSWSGQNYLLIIWTFALPTVKPSIIFNHRRQRIWATRSDLITFRRQTTLVLRYSSYLCLRGLITSNFHQPFRKATFLYSIIKMSCVPVFGYSHLDLVL